MNHSKTTSWGLPVAIFLMSMVLQACGGGDSAAGGGTNTGPQEMSLNQAGYNSSAGSYQYGYRSIANIMISGQPDDLDWSRWAMLHDGEVYRLYFFKVGSNTQIYPFGYNPSTALYEYGYRSIPLLDIKGAPTDADPTSFAMLHDGSDYRLYMRSSSNPTRIYQFAFNKTTSDYEYGYRSIPVMDVTKAPADVDWDRWGMLHDGSVYRHYAFKKGAEDTMYQFGFNSSTSDYEYGYRSIPMLRIENMPDNSDTSDFAMLHDRTDYRFYFLVL